MKPLSIIVAVDSAGGFGKEGKIPWDFPEDIKRFQRITTGSICIMGRKTYDDMLEMRKQRDSEKNITNPIDEILPKRKSIVLTRNPEQVFPGASAADSLRTAIETLDSDDTREIFIIGGEKLFIEALPWTETIYMTIVKGDDYKCDRFFPLLYLRQYFTPTTGESTDQLMFLKYQRTRRD